MVMINRILPKIEVIGQEEIEDLTDIGRMLAKANRIRKQILRSHGWKARFFAGLDICGQNDCWNWTGAIQRSSGHGDFAFSSTVSVRVHRLAYQIFKGPIADGLDVCHACDNPTCCNPSHLWLGTRADNNRDCREKGRAVFIPPPREKRARGERVRTAKLTEEKVLEIFNSNLPSPVLAEKYGVRENSIRAIKLGYNWPHVTGVLHPSKRQPWRKQMLGIK